MLVVTIAVALLLGVIAKIVAIFVIAALRK